MQPIDGKMSLVIPIGELTGVCPILPVLNGRMMTNVRCLMTNPPAERQDARVEPWGPGELHSLVGDARGV